jgi:predicted Zn-dependent protease
MKKLVVPAVVLLLVSSITYWNFRYSERADQKRERESVSDSPSAANKTETTTGKTDFSKRASRMVIPAIPALPNSVDALSKAQQLIGANEIEQAVTLLKAALELDPDNVDLLYKLGTLFQDVFKQTKEAKSYFERAILKSPDEGDILNKLVSIYQESGDVAGGLAFLNRVSAQNPKSAQPLTAAADMMISANRLNEAAGILEQAVRSPGASESTQYLYATTLLNIGTPDTLRRADDMYQTILAGRETQLQERIAKGLPAEVATTNRDLTLMDVVRLRRVQGKIADADRMIQDLRDRRPNDERLVTLMHEQGAETAPPASLAE